jgi:hypothetical protein
MFHTHLSINNSLSSKLYSWISRIGFEYDFVYILLSSFVLYHLWVYPYFKKMFSSSTTVADSTNRNIRSNWPPSHPLQPPSNQVNQDHYLTWKTIILPYINGNNILSHIEGTLPVPPKTIPCPNTIGIYALKSNLCNNFI